MQNSIDGHNSKADTIILNGDIWTADKDKPSAQAIAFKDDIIMKVGSNDEISQLIDGKTNVIDANGKFICPGFIDSHIHFIMGGERLNSVDLKNASTRQEFISLIEEFAKKKKKGEWITGGDWDHVNWGGELPTRFWIDEVTKENPVWIGRHEGHTYLANTLALQIAGLLDKEVGPVEGGTIVHNEKGEITGIFKDNALKLIFASVPVASDEENEKFVESAMDYVIRHGVTSIHHMTEPLDRNRGRNPLDGEVFRKLDQKGKLRTRMYVAVPIQFLKDLKHKIDDLGYNNNSKMLRFGSLKGYIDGSLGSHSCCMFEPFKDTPNYSGDMVNTLEDLYTWIKEADVLGLQVFIHGIGDKGINEMLNIFERVVKENGKKDRRWRIEHSQHIHPNDIHRFAELGVIASVQPHHLIDDGRFIEAILGEERVKGSYAFRSLLDSGAILAFGSDWFVSPPIPLLTIHSAVNRTIDGKNYFAKEESISVEEALIASTLKAAYSVHEENIKGSITEGKLADIVILEKNLFKIDPLTIKDVKVCSTILGGKVLYEN
jgi:predicted amidohydrolase YtcJ